MKRKEIGSFALSKKHQTYRQLLEQLSKLNDKQLDMTLTVEDDAEEEFYPAIFDIVGPNGTSVLCENHPVIRF